MWKIVLFILCWTLGSLALACVATRLDQGRGKALLATFLLTLGGLLLLGVALLSLVPK